VRDAGEHGDGAAVEQWTLLVYTVPSTPSRKRAAVWRAVKRLGALYLRDGVCVLPDTPQARVGLEGLAAQVAAEDGDATLVWDARLPAPTARTLQAELRRARQAEYAEVADTATALRLHLRHEGEHRPFRRAELAGLMADLSRLDRWLAQIAARDYLHDGDASTVAVSLAACRAALTEQVAGTA
jgi:hypothetical protein